MYETHVRTNTIPPSDRTQTFISQVPYDPGEPLRDPFIVDVSYPAFEAGFEALRTDNEGSRNLWKSCEHYKRSSAAYESGQGSFDVHAGYFGNLAHPARGSVDDPLFGYHPWYVAESAGLGDEPMYAPTPDGSFVPPPLDLELLKQRAWKSILPAVKAELSLINSVLELKDFKSLAKTIVAKVKNPASVSTSFAKMMAAFRSRRNYSAKSLSGVASSNYLQWSFAFAPLLSDIAALHRAAILTEKRLNRFITQEGRVKTRHYRVELDELTSSDVSSPRNSYQASFWPALYLAYFGHQRTVTAERSVFHVEIEYNFNFTQYQREHARVLAYLDALGVNFNPAIIWNALKWSFVIDWVIGVSRWLEQFETSLLEPQINIRRSLWSVTRRRRTTIAKSLYLQLTGPPSQTVPMPTVYETAYRRSVELPSISSIVSSGLTLKEVSLGAALIIAVRRRPRRRR